MDLRRYVARALDAIDEWEDSWGSYETHPALEPDSDRLEDAFSTYLERLEGNYPFFHPRYAGQMLKPPHPVAVTGYLAAMCINPNNHALDGGPPTGRMEKEVVAQLAEMLHLPQDTLGHLTGGGTVANMEALWVAREIHPERGIAVSEDAHYTHRRMAEVLGLELVEVPVDPSGRMAPEILEDHLRTGDVGTVVVTAGTTGRGRVDPIARVLELADAYDVRVHADAAYGGFFAPLAWAESSRIPARDLRALSRCDSVVVDPHKHGLQPYGCGCVLFADPGVGRFYAHDSPYTYFTSEEPHLGEVSLECSRPGAAAGALWLTLRVFPPEIDEGLGPVLRAGLRAADGLAERLGDSSRYGVYGTPDLDILVYHPLPPEDDRSLERIDAGSRAIFRRAMEDDDPVFVSVVREPSDRFVRGSARFEQAAGSAHSARSGREPAELRLLRSVLMKPEHERYVEQLHERLEELARAHFDASASGP